MDDLSEFILSESPSLPLLESSGVANASGSSPSVAPSTTPSPSVPAPAPAGPPMLSGPIEIDLRAPALYLNRELSWIEFNARVLAEADSESVPLMERLKFHAIAAS